MNRLGVKDVITTVILSVLIIVMQLVINAVCMLNHFVSMVFTIGITGMGKTIFIITHDAELIRECGTHCFNLDYRA